MRYRLSLLCAVAVLSTVAATLVTINADDALETAEPLQQISPAEVERIKSENAARKADELSVCIYAVADLPVWSLSEKNELPTFNTKVLTALITSTIEPESWKNDGGSISLHDKTRTLVIRTTRANHERIADLFETIRRTDPREEKQKAASDD